MQWIASLYRQSAEASGQPPDQALLAQILAVFQPRQKPES
jgi:hypothetical protein